MFVRDFKSRRNRESRDRGLSGSVHFRSPSFRRKGIKNIYILRKLSECDTSVIEDDTRLSIDRNEKCET